MVLITLINLIHMNISNPSLLRRPRGKRSRLGLEFKATVTHQNNFFLLVVIFTFEVMYQVEMELHSKIYKRKVNNVYN